MFINKTSDESSLIRDNLNSLEDQFFDINRVPGNGFLIFPLSMSRLHMGQDPKSLYQFLCFFENKVTEKTIDVVFLYTNGLYLNNHGMSSSLRKKLNAQMLTHKQELNKIIKKHNQFTPKAIHYVPWDYILLQAATYLDIYAIVLKIAETDPFFRKLLNVEINIKLDKNLENYDFIIEETIVTYLLRQKLVALPNTLANPNGWRLIFYPGRCLIPDVYLHKKEILPQSKFENEDWFSTLTSSAMYNMERKILVDYNRVNLDLLQLSAKEKTSNNVFISASENVGSSSSNSHIKAPAVSMGFKSSFL